MRLPRAAPPEADDCTQEIQGASPATDPVIDRHAEADVHETVLQPPMSPTAARCMYLSCSPNIDEHRKLFFDREASDWHPESISTDVFKLLGDPLPTQDTVGSIYAAVVKSAVAPTRGEIVKIGFTRNGAKQRLKQIKKEHKIEFGKPYEWHNVPYIQLRRLEAVIHADLAYFRRDLLVPIDKGGYQQHHEYFEIPLDIARQRIQFWQDKLDTIGLLPGGAVANKTLKDIQLAHSRSLRASLRSLGQDLSEAERWKRCNEQHELRERAWNEAFDSCAALSTQETQPKLLAGVASSQWGHSSMSEGYMRMHWSLQAIILVFTAFIVRQLPTSSYWIMTVTYAMYKYGYHVNMAALTEPFGKGPCVG